MKTAVIDVGGGMRGMYAAGVLDAALYDHVHFDLAIGISAGSANICSYKAGQVGRNYMFYREYSQRPEYMSLHNFFKTGSMIDMDYIYSTLSNTDGESPLDYNAFKNSPTQMIVVATNAITGKPAYFDTRWLDENQYDILKASCSIPVINKPYMIAGLPFYDGAMSDPIPIDKAFELGAEKIVLILTKPSDVDRKPFKDHALAFFMKNYPNAAIGLRSRIDKYNETVARAKELEKEGKVLIVSPKDTFGIDTLARDDTNLHKLYLEGFMDGKKIKEFVETPITPLESSVPSLQ